MNKPIFNGAADANTLTFTASVAANAEDLLFAGGFEGAMDEVRVSSSARGSDLGAVEIEYDYNARNQLAEASSGAWSAAYSYDANGNTTGTVETAGADTLKTVTMLYDTFNRMTSWSDGTKTETHAYRGAE